MDDKCRCLLEVTVIPRRQIKASLKEITLDANAEPQDVRRGSTFYNKDPYKKLVGELDAYEVYQELLGDNDCRLIIKSIGKGTSDEIITKGNIANYKLQDEQIIIVNGGEMATEEEYLEAEMELQKIYALVMGEQNG